MKRTLILVTLLVALSGCAVNTVTINQYGPVQVSTGSSTNAAR